MTGAEILQNARVLKLEPGDVLVIIPGCDLKMEQYRSARDELNVLLPGTPVFFGPKGTTISAIRPVDRKAFEDDIKKIEAGLR